jgi:RimJ/RimL family protein N-acetyltransferase
VNTVALRQWKDSDFDPYFEMNTDPDVMRHFPSMMTKQEATETFARLKYAIDEKHWGVWAIEVDGSFAGMTGLFVPRFAAPFMPCTEILWRLRKSYWGRGVAYSAAAQALRFGFSTLGLSEIVAFTAASNMKSIRLMERLNFVRDITGDFEHPNVPVGNSLRHHVLYRRRPNQSTDPTP